jgi:hypothetical protein
MSDTQDPTVMQRVPVVAVSGWSDGSLMIQLCDGRVVLEVDGVAHVCDDIIEAEKKICEINQLRGRSLHEAFFYLDAYARLRDAGGYEIRG